MAAANFVSLGGDFSQPRWPAREFLDQLRLENMAPIDSEEPRRKSRLTEDQMVKFLQEADRSPVADVAKKHGISKQTLLTWRKQYGLLEPTDVK